MVQEKTIYIDGEETNYTVTSDGKIFNKFLRLIRCSENLLIAW